jgi:hypothetical protein
MLRAARAFGIQARLLGRLRSSQASAFFTVTWPKPLYC